MIDDARSGLTARFVGHDSTEEDLRQLGGYVKHGRPVSLYTDKTSLFQNRASGAISGMLRNSH
jgi:hypothetical protein